MARHETQLLTTRLQPVEGRRTTVHRLFKRPHDRDVPRSGDLERDQSFSWSRCLVAVFSYGLLLTDIIRTGLGIRHWTSTPTVEPDSVLITPPFAYPVVHINQQNVSSGAATSTWLYKYDSTSITMRSLVQLLGLTTWPRCLLYQPPVCDEPAGITSSTLFSMIDSLVEHVSRHAALSPNCRRGRVTVRSEHRWADRLHDVILPQLFGRNIRRTGRATYYAATQLPRRDRTVCSVESHSRDRPLACDENWTKMERHCWSGDSYAYCRGVDDVWSHIARRRLMLHAAYPNETLDMTIIEGMDDFSRGGLVFHGKKFYDVVLLTRIRRCDDQCTTIAVDDFRYEGSMMTTSVSNVFPIVAVLRAIGQSYAWVRLALLIAGIFRARSAEPNLQRSPLSTRCQATIRTLFLVPSQVVVYGSIVPITCYVAAHAIDASAVYEYVARHFNTPLGAYKFDLTSVVVISSVSLRSVWVMAATCHVLQAFYFSRVGRCPYHGVPGTPELVITALAGSTVFAQVRVMTWRDSRVLEVVQVTDSTGLAAIRSWSYDNARGTMNKLVLGTTIDAQFLFVSLSLLSAVSLSIALLRRVFPSRIPLRVSMLSDTAVPFSAVTLWPSNALVVSWGGSLLQWQDDVVLPGAGLRASLSRRTRRIGLLQLALGPRRPSNVVHSIKIRAQSGSSLPQQQRPGRSIASSIAIDNFHRRSDATECEIYLLNLAIMTDPLTWLLLRVRLGCPIGLYRSRLSDRCFLLPLQLHAVSADVAPPWEDLELIVVVDASELNWWELLQCG
ncbi:hypothetical protein P43SY_006798 [Pythium insidiosum]|uniref:Uncharacterized protein n=1 Tax=Pythium insidiosum TaxID=114742 RepID=A0AAD5QB92_PYTIN|nr:hypothetical protein P43SY_006798 [Pythium insidiosum]